MKTIELTVTRIREDIGHDSFIVKGKLGSAYVELEDNGQWYISDSTQAATASNPASTGMMQSLGR